MIITDNIICSSKMLITKVAATLLLLAVIFAIITQRIMLSDYKNYSYSKLEIIKKPNYKSDNNMGMLFKTSINLRINILYIHVSYLF